MQRHKQHGLFAVDRVGPADDCGLGDLGQLVDDRLDLAGVDVLAAADDHVLCAVDQNQITVLVQPADVPGVQPAVDNRIGRLLGPVQVAAHDVRALDHNLTGLTIGHRTPRRVDDADRLTRHWQSHGARLALAVQRIDRAGARPL